MNHIKDARGKCLENIGPVACFRFAKQWILPLGPLDWSKGASFSGALIDCKPE
jgi:hypothetical protein